MNRQEKAGQPLPPHGMSDRAAAGREVYARNLGVDPTEAERLMTERAAS